MEKSSNKSSYDSMLGRNHNSGQLEINRNVEHTPISVQPQHFSRCYHGMPSSSTTILRDPVNWRQPLFHYAGSYGQNIRPWLKNINHSDQNTGVNSSDSVIINFDNISAPTTSHSGGSHNVPIDTSHSQQYQYVSTVESTRTSGNDNVSNSFQESDINASSFFNGNQSQSNINGNSSVSQNGQGPQTNDSDENDTSGNESLNKIFNKYTYFLTFLTFKVIYDHREGILIFVGLLITFMHANSVVKREIAKQNRRNLISLGIIFVNLLVSIWCIYFIFRDQHLYTNLVFIPPYSQPLSIWDVLWVVGITDFVLKFITIQLKVGMACFPGKWLPYSSRGKWYLLLESASQLYRGLVPIQPWLYYLMEIYQGPESIIGILFSIAYVLSKGSEIMSKVKLFLKAVWKLIDNSSLGTRPSDELMLSAGSLCPICHDEYNAPVMLQCRHVFCENCVSAWFDRQQTCPLCRAKIADDPSWKDGATSLYTQLF